MQTVLKNVTDDRLRAYIIWLPMLKSDDRASAEKRSGEFADKRLSYFWDGEQITGKVWQRVLDIPRVAWDVYFIYGAEARWPKEPTVPDFWMHQLSGAEKKAPFLNQSEFELKVKEWLGKVKVATATIRVEGMTCGGCAAAVRQALANRDGVKSVEVSFEKKQALVTYDPAKVTPQQLAETINQTGFTAKWGKTDSTRRQ
jgi:copper chaperone CopZ